MYYVHRVVSLKKEGDHNPCIGDGHKGNETLEQRMLSEMGKLEYEMSDASSLIYNAIRAEYKAGKYHCHGFEYDAKTDTITMPQWFTPGRDDAQLSYLQRYNRVKKDLELIWRDIPIDCWKPLQKLRNFHISTFKTAMERSGEKIEPKAKFEQVSVTAVEPFYVIIIHPKCRIELDWKNGGWRVELCQGKVPQIRDMLLDIGMYTMQLHNEFDYETNDWNARVKAGRDSMQYS